MHEPVIVIPTYWSKGNFTNQDIIYDHPTNLLDPEQTISQTLQSFSVLQGKFKVLVIAAPTRPSIGQEMDQHLQILLKALNLSYSIFYFGFNNYQLLKSHCDERLSLKPALINLISNRGYGNIRNLCLLIPHLMGFNKIILIDDDEVIIDPDFISKAMKHIGTLDTKSNEIIGLVCGFYRNSTGSIYLDENLVNWWEVPVWNKSKFMNKTFLQLESSPDLQLIDTPLAFGGNMVITKESWIKVPFDPLIPRGEDMDYLRNVKHAGFEAKLDKSISIIHRPPTSTTSYIHKFKQDTFRFLYAKYKMEALGIDPKDYQPYPGYFLEATEAKVLITELLYNISHYHQDLMNIQSWNDLVEKLQNFPSIFSKALAFAKDHAKSYLHFQAQWQKLLISLVLDDSFVLTERI